MSRNTTILEAMAAAKLTAEELCQELDVHQTTINRWIANSSRPRAGKQIELAAMLGVSVDDLWPSDIEDALSEVTNVWPARSDAPSEVWSRLLQPNVKNVDILGYAVGFLVDIDALFLTKLAGLAALGTEVRICLAQPGCSAVAERDAEEDLGGTLKGRIENSLALFRRSFANVDSAQFRLHSSPLYNSVFRFDDEMLVTPHTFAEPGAVSPMLQLKRRSSEGLFDVWGKHFERTWESAETYSFDADV